MDDPWAEETFTDGYFVVETADGDPLARFRHVDDAVRCAQREAGDVQVILTADNDWEGPQVWPDNESRFTLEDLAAMAEKHLWRASERQVSGYVLEFTVPPGTYFIGDPCYCLPREVWPHGLEGRAGGGGAAESAGGDPMISWPTGGDGGCRDQERHVYNVDSGTLGIMPASAWGSQRTREELGRVGRVVDFTEDEPVVLHPGNLLRFGPYYIEID